MDFTINYIAIVGAALASFVVGFLWHGPLFGKQWMKLSGITQRQLAADAKKDMPLRMVAAFVQQLITAFVLAHFVKMWGVGDVVDAAELAFWIWLGFVTTVLLNGVLWEKRSPNLYLFNIAYHLVSLFVMTLVLAMWR